MNSGALVLLGLVACQGPKATPQPPQPDGKRPFAPFVDGQLAGVSYGPFREGQRPGGPNPSRDQIVEDLRLIARDFRMIRMYSALEPTPTVLEAIATEGIPLQVMVGAWISPDDAQADQREVDAAIRLAQAYPEHVIAVAVGNETQVFWSGHRSDRDALVTHLRRVRSAIAQPVTTADDYNFWNKPEAAPVAETVDFICLHAYAMWNKQQLDDAVAWTARTLDQIAGLHPDLPIVMCESGWATTLNPDAGGDQATQVTAPAGEAEQARFYRELTSWAQREAVPYFYFEAFDEPWKGSEDPREIEKHWGLYDVERQPKAALREAE